MKDAVEHVGRTYAGRLAGEMIAVRADAERVLSAAGDKPESANLSSLIVSLNALISSASRAAEAAAGLQAIQEVTR